jgi:glycosyltransferase involved in cell wall biosynthesis
MRKIALIPVYNEESTLLSVLEALIPHVDGIEIVDDGSSDQSSYLASKWARGRRNVNVLRLPENRGMSAALREGFVHLAARLQSAELDPEDILLTIDADGQHDAQEIGSLCEFMETGRLDVVLTRRDFSLYPHYKRIGNSMMTLWGSLWSGFRYRDVESGFRALRLKVLPPLLDYYTGYRYSCAQEIAVLTARLGFRVDNSFKTIIRLYRSQTSFRDVILNASLGFWAFARWALHSKVAPREALARPVIRSESS